LNLKNHLETSVYTLKTQLDDPEKLGSKVSDEDKETLREACNDVIEWLEQNTDAERDDYKEKQAEFDEIVQPILKDMYQTGAGAGGPRPGGAGGDEGDSDDYASHEEL